MWIIDTVKQIHFFFWPPTIPMANLVHEIFWVTERASNASWCSHYRRMLICFAAMRHNDKPYTVRVQVL